MATILAVDDSASMRQMVSFTLKNEGHNVTSAADGDEAFAIAKTKKFDLVITDQYMPKMTGIELAHALRGLPAYKFTPILLLTTEASKEKKLEGKAAGATGWIVKPFDPEKLLSTIKRVLN